MLSIYMGFSACLGCGSFYSISCHTCQSGISFDVVGGVILGTSGTRLFAAAEEKFGELLC